MRALVSLAVLLALLVSGCIADPRALAPPEPTETTLPWGLAGCSFVVAVVPVPPERLADRMPEGFRSLTFEEIGLPADPRGRGNLGVEAWRCNDGVGHNESVLLNDVSYGAVFSFVEPPEALRHNESRYHFVKWDVLIPDAPRRDLLADAGVPALNGSVEMARFQQTAGRLVFDVRLDLNGTYALQGSAAAPADDLKTMTFTEFTPARDGLVRWRTNVTAEVSLAGAGVLAVPAGFARDVLGADRVQSYFLAGSGGAFVNGTIVLPPRPLE